METHDHRYISRSDLKINIKKYEKRLIQNQAFVEVAEATGIEVISNIIAQIEEYITGAEGRKVFDVFEEVANNAAKYEPFITSVYYSTYGVNKLSGGTFCIEAREFVQYCTCKVLIKQIQVHLDVLRYQLEQISQDQKTKHVGRPKRVRPFATLMKDDHGGAKLAHLHEVLINRRPTEITLILSLCVEYGILVPPTYEEFKTEFAEETIKVCKSTYNAYMCEMVKYHPKDVEFIKKAVVNSLIN